jgi:hypothetical protein
MTRLRAAAGRRALLACTPGLIALALASCAGTAPPREKGRLPSGATAPRPDSITVGLWPFDETGGTRAADSGPFRLTGSAGVETRTDFGRLANARSFTRAIESFVVVPYSPAMDEGRGLTLEAWILLRSISANTDTPIAARWTPQADMQSWVFGVIGLGDAPAYRAGVPGTATPGALEFAFQPEQAGPPQAYFSTTRLEVGRWTHVAVTYDGSVVRLYLDGRLDSQYATRGSIRRSQAPLVIGNLLDPRGLSDFGGDLRASGVLNTSPDAGFDGLIDELRLSGAARATIDAGG